MAKQIYTSLHEHFDEAQEYFKMSNIVGIFLQGSQNYNLHTEFSDVDTKLIVTPSLSDIVMNRPAVSTTHIRANEEHIDFKDIRLMLTTFRKQNLNFLEILFTNYLIVNETYKEAWQELVDHRGQIAHYNVFSAVRSMKGIAGEKFHALEHPYPSKLAVLAKYGYDPKQLHHLLRVRDYLERYIQGESYVSCLQPTHRNYLIEVKLGLYTLEEARRVAEKAMAHIETITAPFTKDSVYNHDDPNVDRLLDKVQEEIMTKSIRLEIG